MLFPTELEGEMQTDWKELSFPSRKKKNSIRDLIFSHLRKMVNCESSHLILKSNHKSLKIIEKVLL